MDPSNVGALEKRKADLHKELGSIRRQIRNAQMKQRTKSSKALEGGRTPRPSLCARCSPCCVGKTDEKDVEAGDDDEAASSEREPLVPVQTRHFGTKGQAPGSIVIDESDAEEIRSHFDYPSEAELVVTQMGMSLGYSAYVITSWLYCGAVRHEIFQDCTKTWPNSMELAMACEVASVGFWTLPLYALFVLHVWYYRDLLCTRLYYEMLAHNVFLDFENVPFFQAASIRVLLVWMFVAVLLYPLNPSLLSIRGLKLTASFWIPLGSFIGGVLYASWDLETRLLSLSKYVEREFDDAKVHIDSSLFMPDYVARQGFLAARSGRDKQLRLRRGRSLASEELSKAAQEGESSPHKVVAAHTTGEYIRAIAQQAVELEEKGELIPADDNDAGTGQSSLFAAFSDSYWVTGFLYCPHLEDERAVKFRTLFRVYKFYAFLLIFFVMYLFFCTAISHLMVQRWISESWLTRLFDVERFLIMPVAAPPPEL